MSRGEVIAALRQKHGISSQGKLGELAGLHLTTVARAENDGPSDDATLTAIARVFGMDLPDFYETVKRSRRATLEADRIDLDVAAGYKKEDIPVVAEGEASPQGALFWNVDEGKPLIEADEWMSRPGDVTDPRAYAVRVRGDSMVPAYYPGMRLIVTPNIPVKSGHRVYVELHGGERLIKVARRLRNGWLLESLNPVYESREVSDEEVGTMHKIAYAKEL